MSDIHRLSPDQAGAIKLMHYVIISPVRNEGKFLPATIASVTRQTILPQAWIIVDDGSSDKTGQLADEASRTHGWIRVIHRPDRGFRKSGAGVMDAFYEGYRLIEKEPWEFLLKLDGDLEFGPDFFQRIFEAFDQDASLGISGGDIYHQENGEMAVESRDDPAFHVRGATKFYRRACWDEMGGIPAVTGWDTLDEVKANMLGWKTRRVSETCFLHLRPTGAADGGWKNAFKNGRGSYISGYHPIYMLSKCVKRIAHPPFLIHSLGLFCGFFTSYFGGVGQIKDRELIGYLRKQQLRRLVGLPSIWR